MIRLCLWLVCDLLEVKIFGLISTTEHARKIDIQNIKNLFDIFFLVETSPTPRLLISITDFRNYLLNLLKGTL